MISPDVAVGEVVSALRRQVCQFHKIINNCLTAPRTGNQVDETVADLEI